jgi:hypothetical protein
VHLLQLQCPDEGIELFQLQRVVLDALLVVVVLQIFGRRGPERAQLARAIGPGFAKLDYALREILFGLPPSANRMRRFAGVLNLGAGAVCIAILRPGLAFARRFTSVHNAALAQQFSGTIRPHRFAEMETLCLRHGVG